MAVIILGPGTEVQRPKSPTMVHHHGSGNVDEDENENENENDMRMI